MEGVTLGGGGRVPEGGKFLLKKSWLQGTRVVGVWGRILGEGKEKKGYPLRRGGKCRKALISLRKEGA